jgi:predicted GTPase
MRHPMPCGALEAQAVQRLASLADLDAAACTVKEREVSEPHIRAGGVDHARIMAAAAREADLILWDGGNNDLPFLRPDWLVVLADALRPGCETGWHPGEAALRMAGLVLVAKVNAAEADAVVRVETAVRAANPRAVLVRGASVTRLDRPDLVRGRRVLVIEDGPTLTHGGMAFGAGIVAARAAGAAGFVDPRAAAAPGLAEVYARHPHLGAVLPALGYGADQLADLQRTVAASGAEAVVVATPCDLGALIDLGPAVARVAHDHAEVDDPPLAAHLDAFLDRAGLARGGPS